MLSAAIQPIPSVVQEHAAESAALFDLRSSLLHELHVSVYQLRRHDDRLAAHLDGLAVAGEHAWPVCEAAIEVPSAGAVFTVAVRAIEEKQQRQLDRLFALTEAVPEAHDGLLSAFGWVEPDRLQGIVTGLLGSEESFRRMVGVSACAMHRVDPGLVSARRLQDASPPVRSRALRSAGELGRHELVSTCAAAMADEDPECQMWAAWSSVLLGNRGTALETVASAGLTPGAHRARAFRLALQAMSTSATRVMLQRLASDPEQLRWLIQGSGIAGDPAYVPWLIGWMANEQTARLAGEAFSLITGADFASLNLERTSPEDEESEPNDDPDDSNIEMDQDESLPWPDPERVQRWWVDNAHRFQAGARYFIGAPVTRGHCIDVLKTGYQRQRILAATYLCLLEPGAPLFNTSAPAWRQQKLLAQMG